MIRIDGASMRERFARALLVSALALIVVSAGASARQSVPAAAPLQQVPNLAGRWELNVQASDPSRAEMPTPGEGAEGRRGGGGRGGGGRGGSGGGMGGRGGGMGGRGGMGGEAGRGGRPQESSTVREEIRRALEAPRVLLIVQHETSLSLTDGEGRVVSLKPDGTKVKEQQAGVSVERTTRWDGRSLVTMTKLSNGAKATKTFTKISEGLQLVVVTKIEGGRLPNPLEFKRVYDQALQGSDHEWPS